MIELDGLTEQPEAGIVDEILDVHVCIGQPTCDFISRTVVFEIAGNKDRRLPAGGRDLACQGCQAIFAPRRQCHTMTVPRENTRKLGAYSR